MEIRYATERGAQERAQIESQREAQGRAQREAQERAQREAERKARIMSQINSLNQKLNEYEQFKKNLSLVQEKIDNSIRNLESIGSLLLIGYTVDNNSAENNKTNNCAITLNEKNKQISSIVETVQMKIYDIKSEIASLQRSL